MTVRAALTPSSAGKTYHVNLNMAVNFVFTYVTFQIFKELDLKSLIILRSQW